MRIRILRHIQLVFRLALDNRISFWLKLFFIYLPLAYAVIPHAVKVPDFIPVLGLLDDIFLFTICSLLLRALAPDELVREHLLSLAKDPAIEAHRHSEEDMRLATGLMAMIIFMTIFGGSVILTWFVLILVVFFFRLIRLGSLVNKGTRIDQEHHTELWQAVQAQMKDLPITQLPVVVHNKRSPDVGLGTTFRTLHILVSQAYLDENGAEVVAREIALLNAHLAFGHTGLMFFLDCDLTQLSRLMFHRWTLNAEASAKSLLRNAAQPKASASMNPDWNLEVSQAK